MRERPLLTAGFAQGMASNESNTPKTARIGAHYAYRRTLGGGVQRIGNSNGPWKVRESPRELELGWQLATTPLSSRDLAGL